MATLRTQKKDGKYFRKNIKIGCDSCVSYWSEDIIVYFFDGGEDMELRCPQCPKEDLSDVKRIVGS